MMVILFYYYYISLGSCVNLAEKQMLGKDVQDKETTSIKQQGGGKSEPNRMEQL